MYVVSEDGLRAVNLDQVMVLQIIVDQVGEASFVANPVNSPQQGFILASGGDRPVKAAKLVTAALKTGKRVLDLNDALGDRPNLVVPSGPIILPPGTGRPE